MIAEIIIDELSVKTIIGCNPEERISPQILTISLAIQYDIKKASATDNIDYSVNYSDLCKFSDVLIKTILCCKETDYIKLKGLIKTLTSKKILKLANVKKGFTNNLKQFNDIAIDYPKATQNLNKLITYSTKSNIIKQDFIDDLIKKYNIEII
mgnify:CR=1 FL=1